MLSSLLGVRSLEYLDYDDACSKLTEAGYFHLADGDWAQVFKAPSAPRVIRVTPYDPAYRVFAESCVNHPHLNLPTLGHIVPLAKFGYAVELPLYEKGSPSDGQQFLDVLKLSLEGKKPPKDIPVMELARILSEALTAGHRTVPHFAGIDWNVDNVMFLGGTPILIDAFYQDGPTITAKLKNCEEVEINEEELKRVSKNSVSKEKSFLAIRKLNP